MPIISVGQWFLQIVERTLLSFPIGPIPTSLFHDDGTMRTTSKTDLTQHLEQDVSIIQTLPFFYIFRTILIRDGMPLLQSLNAKSFRTFGEMALDLKKNQISCFQLASVVVDIFDRYDIQSSIKKAEQDRRSKSVFTAKMYEVIEGRVISDWKKFISSGENKHCQTY